MNHNVQTSITGRRAFWAEQLQLVSFALLVLPCVALALAVISLSLHQPLLRAVLPAAWGCMALFLFALTRSWRRTLMISALAGAVFLGSGIAAHAFYDGSWDGLALHEEAVLRLAAGWNPIYESSTLYGTYPEVDLFIDHYPKGAWINAALVFLASGSIETGKLYNFSCLVASFACLVSVLLRVTSLRMRILLTLALLMALNPVAVYQSTTFYQDGQMACLLTIVAAGLFDYLVRRSRRALVIVLPAAILIINLKFTALVYVVIFFSFTLMVLWVRHGWTITWKIGAMGAATGLIGVFLIGYAPYTRNILETSSIFYPLFGPDKLDLLTGIRPANIANKDRFSRFLVASFSVSQNLHYPRSTELKFPLMVYPRERHAWESASPDAGGFGPLYGALLVGVAIGLAAVIKNAERDAIIAVLLAFGCTAASVFVHGEGWLARYVPQAWFFPMITIVALFTYSNISCYRLGLGLLTLASLDIAFIVTTFAWDQVKYTQEEKKLLQQMIAANPKPEVYFGQFPSLRERFREAGISYGVKENDNPISEEWRPTVTIDNHVLFLR